jgi:quercetin 2,3-dioxygenase
MEIITYIVHGGLYHKDSMGTEETLNRGSIQFMTAGKGITHEEFNNESRPLRFIQTWILPRSQGLAPKYGSFSNSLELRRNTLQHLVSDVKNAISLTPVKVNQDIDTYAAELEMGKKVELSLAEGRMAYALCIEGGVTINQKQLMKYDGCEITGSGGLLEIEATHVEETETGNVSHILIFVLPAEKGAGRTDI